MSGDTRQAPKHTSPIVTPQTVILGITLVVLLLLLSIALQADFKGGRFITCAIVIGSALVATVLVQAISASMTRKDSNGGDVPMSLDERDDFGWAVGARVLALVGGVFTAILTLGMVLGTAVAVFVIVRMHMRDSYRTAALFAAGCGLVVPIFFSLALDVAIWPGVILEIVPRWVGGGVLPPL